MKRTFRFIITMLLSGWLMSCNNFLEIKPKDFLSADEYYQTEGQLEASLVGVYDILGSAGLYGSRMLYLLGLEVDEGYYTRNTLSGPQTYNFESSNPNIGLYWTACYTGISRANTLLASMDINPQISESAKSRIRGEALFLRGYYYFLLVQSFGGVPLLTAPTTNVHDVDIPRATDREVYEQILKDMIEAEGLVPGIRSIGHSGRVSKSAVRGVLARVCLYMAGEPVKDIAKYEDARYWAKKVMDDIESGHDLNPDYADIFMKLARDEYDIKESIWEVEFLNHGASLYNEGGNTGYVNGPRTTNSHVGDGYGGVRATTKLYQLHSPGDLRRDWSIAGFTYVVNSTTGAKTPLTSVTAAQLYNRDCGKFRREYETIVPKVLGGTTLNFPLLRYSDVLLMFAEADNEINGAPGPEAIEAVNKVRRRAFAIGGVRSISITNRGSGYTSAPTVTFSAPPAGGAAPAATATLASGAVNSLALAFDGVTGSKMGRNYTIPPTIEISGGGGTGATAVAVLYTEADADVADVHLATQESFRQFIRDERARELCFETIRKGDLIRWGTFVFSMHEVGNHVKRVSPNAFFAQYYLNVKPKHVLWPIPASEMAVNSALIQNPQW